MSVNGSWIFIVCIFLHFVNKYFYSLEKKFLFPAKKDTSLCATGCPQGIGASAAPAAPQPHLLPSLGLLHHLWLLLQLLQQSSLVLHCHCWGTCRIVSSSNVRLGEVFFLLFGRHPCLHSQHHGRCWLHRLVDRERRRAWPVLWALGWTLGCWWGGHHRLIVVRLIRRRRRCAWPCCCCRAPPPRRDAHLRWPHCDADHCIGIAMI